MKVKTCPECNSDFIVVTNRRYCHNCDSYNLKLKQRRARRRKREDGHCEKCGKPLNGLAYRCASCQKQHQAQGWKGAGIIGATLELYEQLLVKQQNICAFCRKSSKRTLCWDHDHKTGRPRSLLCSSCNSLLGNFETLIKIVGLQALLDYIGPLDAVKD